MIVSICTTTLNKIAQYEVRHEKRHIMIIMIIMIIARRTIIVMK